MKAMAVVLSCVLVLFGASKASATLIIDSFDAGPQTLMVWASYPLDTNFLSGQPTTEVIGGSRDATLEWVSGTSRTFVDVNFEGSGVLDFAQGPMAEAKLTLIWDGDMTPGLNAYALAADLTDGGNNTGLIASILSIDLPIKLEVSVYTDSGNWSYNEGVFPGGAVGAHYLSFNDPGWVHTGAGADFTNVGAIKIVINGTYYPDTDLRIDYFAAGVPEPSTAIMALLGLVGLGLVRLRRNRG